MSTEPPLTLLSSPPFAPKHSAQIRRGEQRMRVSANRQRSEGTFQCKERALESICVLVIPAGLFFGGKQASGGSCVQEGGLHTIPPEKEGIGGRFPTTHMVHTMRLFYFLLERKLILDHPLLV
ncbi:unnamed protein product [Leuciscus chuanchicus]